MWKIIYSCWLLFNMFIPVLLWLTPISYFEKLNLTTCPSKLFFDLECIGCGLTRAVFYFHKWEFAEAIYFNTSIIIVYPLLFLMWLMFLKELLKEFNIKFHERIPLKTIPEYFILMKNKLKPQ